LQFSRIQVKQINSAQRIFGLKLRIGDLFAVGGPCQRTSENGEGGNVEHLLIRAIEVSSAIGAVILGAVILG